jgi:hypothetical protein
MKALITMILIAILASCNHSKIRVTDHETQPLQPSLNQLISDSLIYDFMSYKIELIRKDDTNKIYLLNAPEFFCDRNDSISIVMLNSMSNLQLIDTFDLPFVFDQIQLSKTYLYKQDLLIANLIPVDSIKVLSENDDFWPNYRQKYVSNGFWRLSVPIFSMDKQTVIQNERFSCGSLCGGGGTYIYRKINNSWKLIYGYNFNVS